MEKIVKRVNSAVYSLNFFCHFITLELRKRLVFDLVFTYLAYYSNEYLNISGDLKERTQTLKNKCIRYVTGLQRDDHVTPARRQLVWLTTGMQWMYFPSIIIYEARRIGQPKYLAELFETRGRIDLGRGDAIPELKLPSWSSEAGKKSLVYECAKFWNELPNNTI